MPSVWENVEKLDTYSAGVECKIVQQQRKIIPQKLNIEILYDPEILHLGIYPIKLKTEI